MKLTKAQREEIYRTAENAEFECSRAGCRRRDCSSFICRRSVDEAIAVACSLLEERS